MNIPSILDTANFRHLVLDGVNEISTAISSFQGFQIPEYDELALTYYGATNNIATVLYKKTGATVATLTLTYSVQPPILNDANLVNVIIS
jgi:CHASE3 domain sensor protein